MSRKRYDHNIKEILINNESIVDNDSISEALNKHFAEIGPSLAAKIPVSTKCFESYIASTDRSFEFTSISHDTVYKLLNNLSVNKATGLDNVPCRLAKEAASIIAPSICNIFNASIGSGIFHSDWK